MNFITKGLELGISVLADVATLGGVLLDKNESMTSRTLRRHSLERREKEYFRQKHKRSKSTNKRCS